MNVVHEAAQLVPVKADTYAVVQPGSIPIVPEPQQTGVAPEQSMGPRQPQSVDPVVGHAVAAGSQVEGGVVPPVTSGGSQQ